MRKTYKQAYEKIVPSQELVNKTDLAMKRMQEKQKKQVKRLAIFKYCAAAAACLVMVFLLADFFKTPAPEASLFITKLSAGQYVGYVELNNGFISFEQENNTDTIKPTNYLGNRSTRESWSVERYMEYLGADITPGYLPKELTLQNETAEVYLAQDGRVLTDICTLEYASTQGKNLQINVAKGELPINSRIAANDNSSVDGHSLAVGTGAEAEVYWAQFINNGVGYYIESKHINQQEFIMIICDLLK